MLFQVSMVEYRAGVRRDSVFAPGVLVIGLTRAVFINNKLMIHAAMSLLNHFLWTARHN